MDPSGINSLIEIFGAMIIPTVIVFWLLNYVLKRLDDIKSYQKEIAELLTKIICIIEKEGK